MAHGLALDGNGNVVVTGESKGNSTGFDYVLARAGVASVTVFETSGWRGVLETEAGSPLPQLFHSKPGTVFPVYFALAALAGYSRAWVTVVPGKLAALRLSGHGP